MKSRLNPPISQHDAYTLRSLQAAIVQEIQCLLEGGLLDNQSGLVVDLGAGEAPYRDLFTPHCRSYIACDIERRDGIDLVISDKGAVDLPDATASCVVSFQVLEHVWDLDAYFAECARLLAPDGRLLLSTHGTWLYHPHPGDYRRWTRDGLVRELKERGFVVEKAVPLVGALAWTTQFRLIAYHHVFSRLPVVGRSLASILAVAMYFRMLLEDAVTPAAIRADNAAVYLVVARHAG